MVVISTSSTEKDLQGILELQRRNLSSALSAQEKQDQGFVTVAHSFDDLKKMQIYEPNIIAKDNDVVVAYVLAMTESSKTDIAILEPMFNGFNHIEYKGKPISDHKYMVVGQVCVDKRYRGEGLFDKCYHAFKDRFKLRFDFAITEVATVNLRSMKAHRRIGFNEIFRAKDETGLEWSVVIWDWKA